MPGGIPVGRRRGRGSSRWKGGMGELRGGKWRVACEQGEEEEGDVSFLPYKVISLPGSACVCG